MKITDFLSKLINDINAKTGGTVLELANIATLSDGDEFLPSKSSIILSIVNIEEDKILNNQTLYKDYVLSNDIIEKHKNPTQNLILSLLFTSYNIDQLKYTEGIDKLETVIRYFQKNQVFYWQPQLPGFLNAKPETGSYDKLIFKLISLNTEQLNQMWSYLGARYMPSVLYQVKMIAIQEKETFSDEIIKEAEVQLWENNPSDPVGHLESVTFTKDTND